MVARISGVRALEGYRLELAFTDGTRGVADLTDWVVGQGGVFEALEHEAFFRQVRVNQELGTIQWPNDVDLCPDVLYSRVTGKPVSSGQPDPGKV